MLALLRLDLSARVGGAPAGPPFCRPLSAALLAEQSDPPSHELADIPVRNWLTERELEVTSGSHETSQGALQRCVCANRWENADMTLEGTVVDQDAFLL